MADIPINEVTRRVQFTGNTTTGPFAFTFNILSDDDIIVYKNFVLQTITTHYTVSTNANGTGSITLTSPLVASDVLTIIGGRALERTTDFVTAGDLLASSLNEQLDSQVIMTQQLDEKLDRSLKVDIGDQFTDLSLPSKANRLGAVLAFNATSGDPEAGPQIADVSTLAAITADIATLADIEDGTDATDAIQTVAGISSNVSTVAGISGNVSTVAGISGNVTTVAGISANTTTVAGISSDVTTVAGISSNVSTVAGISSNVTTVAGDSADIQALAAKTTELGLLGTADAIADMNTLATSAIVTDLDALANLTTEIDALGDITSAISTVSGISANVTTVAGISANVTSVAGNSTNINAVAGNSTNINAVAADATDIGTVATNISNVNTVAGNNTNINTVAGISSNVTTVAGISANVTTVAGDTTNIGTIATNLNGTDTIGTVAGSISNVNTVGGSITNVNTVASSISDVNSFAERYRIGSTDPTTSLNGGDLFFNTSDNGFKFYHAGDTEWKSVNVSGIGNVVEDVTPQLGGVLQTNGNNIEFPDSSGAENNRLKFGANDDLEIYHDGTDSNIVATGGSTSHLNVYVEDDFTIRHGTPSSFETMASFLNDGAVYLYYDGTTRLNTSSTGVSVSGDLTTGDDLFVNGGFARVQSSSTATLQLMNTDTTASDEQELGVIDFFGSDATTPGAGVKASIKAIAESSNGAGSKLQFYTSTTTANELLAAEFDLYQNFNLYNSPVLRFYDTDASHYAGFDIPSSVTSSYTLTLPSAGPSAADQILVSDASGNLSFEDKPAAAGGTAFSAF